MYRTLHAFWKQSHRSSRFFNKISQFHIPFGQSPTGVGGERPMDLVHIEPFQVTIHLLCLWVTWDIKPDAWLKFLKENSLLMASLSLNSDHPAAFRSNKTQFLSSAVNQRTSAEVLVPMPNPRPSGALPALGF